MLQRKEAFRMDEGPSFDQEEREWRRHQTRFFIAMIVVLAVIGGLIMLVLGGAMGEPAV
jgi:hypothetical protein